MSTTYTDAQWRKIAGDGATFLAPDVAALRASHGTRIYGLRGTEIIRVHTLDDAQACQRVWQPTHQAEVPIY